MTFEPTSMFSKVEFSTPQLSSSLPPGLEPRMRNETNVFQGADTQDAYVVDAHRLEQVLDSDDGGYGYGDVKKAAEFKLSRASTVTTLPAYSDKRSHTSHDYHHLSQDPAPGEEQLLEDGRSTNFSGAGTPRVAGQRRQSHESSAETFGSAWSGPNMRTIGPCGSCGSVEAMLVGHLLSKRLPSCHEDGSEMEARDGIAKTLRGYTKARRRTFTKWMCDINVPYERPPFMNGTLNSADPTMLKGRRDAVEQCTPPSLCEDDVAFTVQDWIELREGDVTFSIFHNTIRQSTKPGAVATFPGLTVPKEAAVIVFGVHVQDKDGNAAFVYDFGGGPTTINSALASTESIKSVSSVFSSQPPNSDGPATISIEVLQGTMYLDFVSVSTQGVPPTVKTPKPASSRLGPESASPTTTASTSNTTTSVGTTGITSPGVSDPSQAGPTRTMIRALKKMPPAASESTPRAPPESYIVSSNLPSSSSPTAATDGGSTTDAPTASTSSTVSRPGPQKGMQTSTFVGIIVGCVILLLLLLLLAVCLLRRQRRNMRLQSALKRFEPLSLFSAPSAGVSGGAPGDAEDFGYGDEKKNAEMDRRHSYSSTVETLPPYRYSSDGGRFDPPALKDADEVNSSDALAEAYDGFARQRETHEGSAEGLKAEWTSPAVV
ncbi:uncharacterized protein BXZ73DRAFT_76973 [Epithele typhae]|uniref:uncharacterized protein n=1 Tax=Epithele typhae TaxID=378194 RepID=UPI002007E243|nr:uncharacterized protein BXZ73DRAFT_76973 [Epithele typhae]KAH9934486.1 hypothetical protein BXZ73DRAFT_76973 [Epithele typhae]